MVEISNFVQQLFVSFAFKLIASLNLTHPNFHNREPMSVELSVGIQPFLSHSLLFFQQVPEQFLTQYASVPSL